VTLPDGGLLLCSYLLGSIPFGYLIALWRSGRDIRDLGSGNIGATNVLRTQGKGWGLLTLILDAGKGAVPVLVGNAVSASAWVGPACGAAAVVGHCFPLWLRFRGGKGIASGLGAYLLIAPLATALGLALFLLVVAATGWVALGSVLASLGFGTALILLRDRMGVPPEVVWIGCGLALLLVSRHHSNIRRLIRGAEPRVWDKGERAES